MITLAKLKELEACGEGLSVFKEAFPSGRVSMEVLLKTAKETELSYRQQVSLGWLAHYTGLSMKDRLQLTALSDEPEEWCGYAACRTEGLTLAERLELINQTRDKEFWSRHTASSAFGLSREEREQLRDHKG